MKRIQLWPHSYISGKNLFLSLAHAKHHQIAIMAFPPASGMRARLRKWNERMRSILFTASTCDGPRATRILTASKSFKFRFGCFHSWLIRGAKSVNVTPLWKWMAYIGEKCFFLLFAGWWTTGNYVLCGGEHWHPYPSSAHTHTTHATTGRVGR